MDKNILINTNILYPTEARLGAATSAGPLRVLKPRNVPVTPRPSTPEVEAVPDDEEASHQSALMMQRLLKGRAVQNLVSLIDYYCKPGVPNLFLEYGNNIIYGINILGFFLG